MRHALPGSAAVLELKHRIEGATGIPAVDQRLVAGTAVLKDESSMSAIFGDQAVQAVTCVRTSLPLEPSKWQRFHSEGLDTPVFYHDDGRLRFTVPEARILDQVKPLLVAAGNCDVEALGAFLEHGVDEHVAPHVQRAIYIAASRGHLQALEVLFQGLPKSMPELAGDSMNGVLFHAAHGGQLETVRVALEYGADRLARDPLNGATALHLASIRGHLPVAQELVVSSAGFGGAAAATVLLDTGAVDHMELVDRMLEARTLDGDTPIMAAAAGGHRDIVDFLVDCGADLAATSNAGLNAEEIAAFRGHHALASALRKLILPGYHGPRHSGAGGNSSSSTDDAQPAQLDS